MSLAPHRSECRVDLLLRAGPPWVASRAVVQSTSLCEQDFNGWKFNGLIGAVGVFFLIEPVRFLP